MPDTHEIETHTHMAASAESAHSIEPTTTEQGLRKEAILDALLDRMDDSDRGTTDSAPAVTDGGER